MLCSSWPHISSSEGARCPKAGGGGVLSLLPDDVLAERGEGLLLVVTEHLKHDGLGPDVLHERLGHLHRDLTGHRTALRLSDVTLTHIDYIAL